jgi:outer membrane lipoprotein-sorting protein
MKKTIFTIIMMLVAVCASAQSSARVATKKQTTTTTKSAQAKASQARKVLDKTASIVGRKGGASASFKISSAKIGSTQGTIYVKGNKFHARTPQAIVWFNGKTQWTYMKSTDEVNVSNPNEAQQMAMNPYKFINMYKQGYTLSMKADATNYNVRMVAQNKARSVQEMIITVNKKTFSPSKVKMREGATWTTISITGFKAKNQSDATFVFNSKDFPSAEVIDLR